MSPMLRLAEVVDLAGIYGPPGLVAPGVEAEGPAGIKGNHHAALEAVECQDSWLAAVEALQEHVAFAPGRDLAGLQPASPGLPGAPALDPADRLAVARQRDHPVARVWRRGEFGRGTAHRVQVPTAGHRRIALKGSEEGGRGRSPRFGSPSRSAASRCRARPSVRSRLPGRGRDRASPARAAAAASRPRCGRRPAGPRSPGGLGLDQEWGGSATT